MAKSDRQIESKILESCGKMAESLQQINEKLAEWQASDKRKEGRFVRKIRKEYRHISDQTKVVTKLNSEEEHINIEVANKANEIVKEVVDLIEKRLK